MKFVSILFLISSFIQGNSYSFKIGETLKYDAYFRGIYAANAKLEVIGKEKVNNHMTYHVEFTARSRGIINYLFPINDKIDLWLSEDSLFTIKESLEIREGNYKKSRETIFNHKSNFAVSGHDTINIPRGTHSPYSLFYFFRNNEVNQMNSTLNTIQGKKVVPLNVIIEENIKAEVPAGNFLCTKVEPIKTSDETFKNKSQMSILFSKDKNHYPVKIWLNMKYGSLMLELKSIAN